MSQIDNINKLREFAIRTLEKLSNREIEIKEAEATSTLCQMVLETAKVEMMYAKMCGKNPNIAFLNDTPKLVQHDDL